MLAFVLLIGGALQLGVLDMMQEEVPDLLKILQQKGLADRVDLLDLCDPTSQDNVYSEMHNILSRFCEGKMGSWQGRNVTGMCDAAGMLLLPHLMSCSLC